MGCKNTKNTGNPGLKSLPKEAEDYKYQKEEFKSTLKSRYPPPPPVQAPAIEGIKVKGEIKNEYALKQCFDCFESGDINTFYSILKGYGVHPILLKNTENKTIDLPDEQKVSLLNWNVYLLAIVYQKVDFLKYLLAQPVNVREATRHPTKVFDYYAFYSDGPKLELFGL